MKSTSSYVLKTLITTCLFYSANNYAVEITPLIGYRTGGEFVDVGSNTKHNVVSSDSYSLLIGWPEEKGKTIEVYYSHQSSKLNSVDVTIPSVPSNVDVPLTIDYLHIGGTTPISNKEKLQTFVSGGLGFAYLSPDLIGLESDLRASFSIGIGLKYPISKNVAIRLETRGMATLFNSNSALFCNGGCSLTVNGSLFWQAEVLAGVAIKF